MRKRVMKRFWAFLLSVILLVPVLSALPARQAKANDFTTAIEITPGIPITDMLTTKSTKNYYSFTIPSDGMVEISFSRPYQKDSKKYWTVKFYDENYKALKEIDMAGNYDETVFPQIGIPAGTYYLSVSKYSYNYSSDSYSINVDYTPSDVWEKERNGDPTTANPISLGQTYFGAIIRSDDIDYYSFDVTEDGFYTVSFDAGMQSDSKKYWNVYVKDKNYKTVKSQAISGGDGYKEFTVSLSPSNYYIQISKYSYNTNNSTYKLCVDLSQGNAYPSGGDGSGGSSDSGSSGNTPSTPSTIPVSGIALNYNSLELEVGESATLTATVSPNSATNKTVKWISSNTSVATVSGGKVTAKGAGSATITASAGDYSDYCTVTVTDTSEIEAPVVEPGTSDGATSEATGLTLNYTTYYTEPGDMLGLFAMDYPSGEVNNQVTWTSSNPDVAVFVTNYNAVMIYAPGFATVTAISLDGRMASCDIFVSDLASTVINKITAGKGKITLTWDEVYGCDEYEIQYSTNKNFKNAKKTRISAEKYKKTISGLKKGKKYYVRVRSVLSWAGKTYYSTWSPKKTIKTKK